LRAFTAIPEAGSMRYAVGDAGVVKLVDTQDLKS
jgi:hypothetical protein